MATVRYVARMTTTIYHNPRCSNSRGALELIRRAGLAVRDAVRDKEPVYAELGLDSASDEQLLAAMVAHPALINRPFVVTQHGVRLCRPPGLVREILP